MHYSPINLFNRYVEAIEDEDYMKEKIHWWDNVYGFNMQVREILYYSRFIRFTSV